MNAALLSLAAHRTSLSPPPTFISTRVGETQRFGGRASADAATPAGEGS
jgi:hypothetical protein